MNSMSDLRNALHDKLNEKIDGEVRKIANGQARDFAEYKSATGRIQGMVVARDTIDEAFKNLTEENDE